MSEETLFSGVGAKPNVILVMPVATQYGGAELSFLHLLRGGHAVQWHVVFLEDGPMAVEARAAGATVEIVNAGRFRNPFRFIKTVRAIRRSIISTKAQAVLGWMTKSHLYGGTAAYLTNTPAIWFQKGLPAPKALMERMAARIPAAAIFACSNYVAGLQREITPRIPVRAIHSAVELHVFDPDRVGAPSEARRMAGLPATGVLIGIFGRLQHWKGMHVAIAALPSILQQHPESKLIIAGGPWIFEREYAPALHEQVAALGLTDKVVFAGHLNAEQIPLWMQACDVMVHASDREPFGIVILEAMAMGKPVVAGNEAGPTEIITDGIDGLLTPFGDAPALASAILKYLNDPEFARKVGAKAQMRAKQFSAVNFADTVNQAVLEVLAKSSQNRRNATPLKGKQADTYH